MRRSEAIARLLSECVCAVTLVFTVFYFLAH
jgi:hypothetical protein